MYVKLCIICQKINNKRNKRKTIGFIQTRSQGVQLFDSLFCAVQAIKKLNDALGTRLGFIKDAGASINVKNIKEECANIFFLHKRI